MYIYESIIIFFLLFKQKNQGRYGKIIMKNSEVVGFFDSWYLSIRVLFYCSSVELRNIPTWAYFTWECQIFSTHGLENHNKV